MQGTFRVFSAFVHRLGDLGLPVEHVLRRAGLSVHTFQQQKAHLKTEELFALYRSIEHVSGDSTFGLRLGSETRVERYDPVAIAALYANSMRDALGRMARYKQLTCPEAIHYTEQGDECHVRFEWLLTTEEQPPILIDLCFAWVAEIARRGTDGAIAPKRLELKREATGREAFEAHFGCEIRFQAPANVLVLNRADLDVPFVTHNADVLAIVAPQLDRELHEQQQLPSFREQAKACIKRSLAGQRPELRNVARELRLSARTLQRRLTEESVTFQQLVAEARRELAHHYLRHSSLELNETAYLLGYEDANSFFRAFQQWEGTSPGEWRAQLAP